MQILFYILIVLAYAANILDYISTLACFKKVPGYEGNFIARFLFKKSKYAVLAYKLTGPTLVLYLAAFKYKDIKFFNVKYANADGVDKWLYAWLFLVVLSLAGSLWAAYSNYKKLKAAK